MASVVSQSIRCMIRQGAGPTAHVVVIIPLLLLLPLLLLCVPASADDSPRPCAPPLDVPGNRLMCFTPSASLHPGNGWLAELLYN